MIVSIGKDWDLTHRPVLADSRIESSLKGLGLGSKLLCLGRAEANELGVKFLQVIGYVSKKKKKKAQSWPD